MNTATKNRNESYENLKLSKRLQETYMVIKEKGPITPQKAMRYFSDKREIISVASRFTDLRDRGFIKPTMSYINPKTGQSNTAYQITNDRERKDFSISAGVNWVKRIAELETDHLQTISSDTKRWIRNEIKKHQFKLKNLSA